MKKVGLNTFVFESPPVMEDCFTIVGKKEGEGPLGIFFDKIIVDEYVGAKSWELAESKLLSLAIDELIKKIQIAKEEIEIIVGGDLLNQLTASHFAFRDLDNPFIGVYGACSTFALSTGLVAMFVESSSIRYAISATSSHFCSAEKQFRYPLEFGNQRTLTSQWTVTGAAAFLLKPNDGSKKPKITSYTVGKIMDFGIKDANNMGAAMAPAAAFTISQHLSDMKRDLNYYDLVLTGDLGYVGRDLLIELLKEKEIKNAENLLDCGILIFDPIKQDTHAGGSGCAASACVFGGYIYKLMIEGTFKRILIAPTGALLSPTTVQLGESIPVISHAISVEID
ncbi:stage V sporulation protein AD [Caldicellulosiruptoraceae bacterium PP1]